MPFLPPQEIEQANLAIDDAHDAPTEFKEYFISNWIAKKEMISLVSNLETRTNNIMEGFNSYLAKNYQCHMNIWLFLAKFRQEESLFHIKLSQLNEGADIVRQKQIYKRRTELILSKIAARRQEDGVLHFLKQIGRIFYMTR